MENHAKNTYRLYALSLTAENIEIASNERFSRATPKPEPGYVLIYTAGKAPAAAQEIGGERVKLLSQADAVWLLDSNAAIVAEEFEKNGKEVFQELSERVEALENELRRKKEEIDRKGE